MIPFLTLQGKQTVISIATETFYRGLLCVWIRDIGPKSILVSPIAYAAAHIGKPTVEVIGSGPADIVFGYFDYKSESIIPSIVTHSLGMAAVDWLCQHPALFPQIGFWIENLISFLV
jgi:membrane protease YdiL (CAAX protease family)